MLRRTVITAWIEDAHVALDEPFHNLHWSKQVEVSLDCFICRRTRRTMAVGWGDEAGRCTGDRESFPAHPAAVVMSGFGVSHVDARLGVSITLDHWSAPFTDARHPERTGQPLTDSPWVRLSVGSLCPNGAPGTARGNSTSLQTNLVLPYAVRCGTCDAPMLVVREPPSIVLSP